jgi:hypothetical protein
MRLPHETISGLDNEETAWRLLARWELTPDNAELERHTVYTSRPAGPRLVRSAAGRPGCSTS